jgi:hypothetical protein
MNEEDELMSDVEAARVVMTQIREEVGDERIELTCQPLDLLHNWRQANLPSVSAYSLHLKEIFTVWVEEGEIKVCQWQGRQVPSNYLLRCARNNPKLAELLKKARGDAAPTIHYNWEKVASVPMSDPEAIEKVVELARRAIGDGPPPIKI